MATQNRIPFESFFSRNASFVERIDWARRLATSDVRILIQGETGTGKSRLARAIHDASARSNAPFVEVEVAGLPAGEAHERIFTSGIWQAHKGTLAIGGLFEQAPWLVSKVLRINEPFGRDTYDARLILTRVDRGPDHEESLSPELYHRMPEAVILLPPLRHRTEDIRALFEGFVKLACEATGKRVEGWTNEVDRAILSHPWPGNLHELRGVAFSAVIAAKGPLLALGEVTARMRHPATDAADARPKLKDVTRRYARRVLAEENGNVSAAARVLGVSRCTLAEWLKEA